jgi:DNA-binding NarL/FixJ family response regulator
MAETECKSMKVVVADDSAVVLERVAEIIGELPGLEIAGRARDAPETLQQVREFDPEILILDLEMPGGSGLEVLRTVKTAGREIVVIILTNSTSNPLREACGKAGADFFLDKSYEFEQLRNVLAQLVRIAEWRSEKRLAERDPLPPKATL